MGRKRDGVCAGGEGGGGRGEGGCTYSRQLFTHIMHIIYT